MASERGQSQNMWKFAVYSGVRHGELAALAWEDVDLDKGVIHVCRNLTANGMFGPPKTAAGNRTIQLLSPALDALKAQHELTAGHPVSTITFHHREYGSSEGTEFAICFHAAETERRAKTLLLAQQYRQQMGSCSKTRWHSPQESVPYAAYFCLLAPDGWRKPVFYSQSDGA